MRILRIGDRQSSSRLSPADRWHEGRYRPVSTQPALDPPNGQMLHDLCARLYPLCRSITGNAVRQSLAILQEQVPLEIREAPSGQLAFDWEVPLEWNLQEAYIETLGGVRLVDSADHNLHVVSYSVPIDVVCSRDQLEPHLHSLPDRPTWIPYRASYYEATWGFCLTDDQRRALPEGPFHVRIDASLAPG